MLPTAWESNVVRNIAQLVQYSRRAIQLTWILLLCAGQHLAVCLCPVLLKGSSALGTPACFCEILSSEAFSL